MIKTKMKEIPEPTKLSIAVDNLLMVATKIGAEEASHIYLETMTKLAMSEGCAEKAILRLLMHQGRLMEYILEYRLRESEATNANN